MSLAEVDIKIDSSSGGGVTVVPRPVTTPMIAANGAGPPGAPGPAGADGPAGPQGPRGFVGQPGSGFQWFGSWNHNNQYFKNDVVKRDGSTWLMFNNSPVGPTETPPPDDPTHWMVYVEK